MQYVYILLKNYKRFPFLDSAIFEHYFNSKISVITGVNGAGKSSLTSELTPLPTDKSNFYKQGYKEIHIQKDNNLYNLICDFRDTTPVYNFILNDEELNLSNNITTQRELVQQHFNITQSVHDILTGAETFTNMSLLTRKKLFNSLSHLNIDYILSIYNSLKEELKNNELLLKSQTTLYQTEEQKLLNTTHLTSLQDNHLRTKEHLEHLLSIRTHLHQHIKQTNLEQQYSTLKELQNRLTLSYDSYYLQIVTLPNKDIHRILVNHNSKLTLVSYQLQELYSHLEKQYHYLKTIENNKHTNISALESRKNEIASSVSNLSNTLIYLKNTTVSIEEIKNAIYKLEVSLPELLRTIPINEDLVYTKEVYDNLLNHKKQLLDTLTLSCSKEISLTKEIQHLKDHQDNVTCPQCNHTWSPKNTTNTITQLQHELNKILKTKQETQTYLQAIDVKIEGNIQYFSIYKNYLILRSSTHTQLKSFWDYVDTKELIHSDPTAILPILNILNIEVSTIETINALNKELNNIKENIESLSSVKDVTTENILNEIDTVTLQISDLQYYKEYLQKTISMIEKMTSFYSYIEKLSSAINSSIDELYTSNLSHTLSELNNLIETELTRYKVILIEIEKELNQYNSIQNTLARYTETINDTKSNIKVLSVILEELSPKNGLIARSVSSLLNIIIGNINNTISSIWSYKMVLKIIDIENETLNYRFKVEVDDKLEIDDISKVSAGMRKLINFAFTMVLYRLLGLQNYPLMLDEFTTNLDVQHTQKFAHIVNQIAMSDQFSQIFVISHISNDICFSRENTEIINLSD